MWTIAVELDDKISLCRAGELQISTDDLLPLPTHTHTHTTSLLTPTHMQAKQQASLSINLAYPQSYYSTNQIQSIRTPVK